MTAAAETHKIMAPGKTILKKGSEKKEIERPTVTFSPTCDVAESMSTEIKHADWVDEFHKPDGTHPSVIVGDVHKGHAERVRRALAKDSATMDLGVGATLGEAPRRIAREMYFTTGTNDGAELLRKHLSALITRQGETYCEDDVSGEVLDEAGVRAARALEMEFFLKMGVYTYATREEAARSGKGKIIKGRWIDVNKGDSVNPDYRSRFVGKEFNTGVDSSLYAATPPLEALKLLISSAASDSLRSTHIMLSDVKRAYFHAAATRELYVEVPREDPNWKPGLLGKLNLSL